MILRVGAIERVLALSRIIVPAALVEKESGEVAVPRVARLAVKGDQSNLQTLVPRDVGFPAGAVHRDHGIGSPDRGVERRALSGPAVVLNGGFEKGPGRPDRGLRIRVAGVDGGGHAVD